MDREGFAHGLKELGLGLSSDQLSAFEVFEDRLYESNRVMNLTRISREQAWVFHFLDSLLGHSLMPIGAKVLDIGTGPGFPAWPLACARPDLHVSALDSSGKMLGFLKANLLPNLEFVESRAEEFAQREVFDVVTGRAVAPLGVQLEISATPCKVGGAVIPMRTSAERELIQATPCEQFGLVLESIGEQVLPTTDIVRLFPVFRKFKRTPNKYPRTWAEIKRDKD